MGHSLRVSYDALSRRIKEDAASGCYNSRTDKGRPAALEPSPEISTTMLATRVKTARRAALVLALPILLIAASPAAGEDGVTADSSLTDMDELLEKLADRAEKYRRFALGFTCEESVVRSQYNAEKGTFKRRDRELYDYLLTTNEESGRLEEVREIVEENGKKVRRNERELNVQIPPSYAWSQIFARSNRARFFFRPAGRLVSGYRLLIQIDFAGSAAEPGTADISGWTGRISVDSETLNIQSLRAEPTGQDARIEAERLKYQRAFAIMGVPLASRPKSRSVEVNFAFENGGLTYPAEATVTKSVYVSSAEQGLEEKTVLRYRSYRFFVTGAQQEEARDKPAAPPDEGDLDSPPGPVTPDPLDPNVPAPPPPRRIPASRP